MDESFWIHGIPETFRLKGRLTPVSLDGKGVNHPRSPRGDAFELTPYEDVTHIAVSERGVWLGAKRSVYVLSRSDFEDETAPERFADSLLRRIGERPGGEAQLRPHGPGRSAGAVGGEVSGHVCAGRGLHPGVARAAPRRAPPRRGGLLQRRLRRARGLVAHDHLELPPRGADLPAAPRDESPRAAGARRDHRTLDRHRPDHRRAGHLGHRRDDRELHRRLPERGWRVRRGVRPAGCGLLSRSHPRRRAARLVAHSRVARSG